MVIEHKRPSPVVASVAGARVVIEVRATLREKSFGLVGEAAIAQKTLFSMEYPQGKSFDEWSRILHRLRNFLTLGVGELVEPLALRGTMESSNLVAGLTIGLVARWVVTVALLAFVVFRRAPTLGLDRVPPPHPDWGGGHGHDWAVLRSLQRDGRLLIVGR